MGERHHFYVIGLYHDGSNVEDAANGARTRAEPFHSFRDASMYRDGLDDSDQFGATLVVAADCECEESGLK